LTFTTNVRITSFGTLSTATLTAKNTSMVTSTGVMRNRRPKTPHTRIKAHYAAKPILTRLPEGTILILEKIYIRKHLGKYDSLTFRIPKENKSGVPHGKFWAALKDINGKLEADPEVVNKYPNGRFTVQVIEGQQWYCNTCRAHYPCKCAQSGPTYKTEILEWVSDPNGNSRWDVGRMALVVHKTDSTGLDDIKIDDHSRGSDGYAKRFDNLDDMISWADSKKAFSHTHIDAFIKRYEEQKSKVEADQRQVV
jgi:hypothetical protein